MTLLYIPHDLQTRADTALFIAALAPVLSQPISLAELSKAETWITIFPIFCVRSPFKWISSVVERYIEMCLIGFLHGSVYSVFAQAEDFVFDNPEIYKNKCLFAVIVNSVSA